MDIHDSVINIQNQVWMSIIQTSKSIIQLRMAIIEWNCDTDAIIQYLTSIIMNIHKTIMDIYDE